MTDHELEVLFAEKVLGWRVSSDPSDTEAVWHDPLDGGLHLPSAILSDRKTFAPLTDLNDAFAGLAEHPEWAWEVRWYATEENPKILVSIWYPDDDKLWIEDEGDDINRAIILCCLRAVGCEV